jgi:hypothetical protein
VKPLRINWPLATVTLLLLIGVFGGRNLNIDPIWYDEAWSLHVTGGAHFGPLSPVQVVARVASDDPRWAPGYFVLLNLWGKLTGWEAVPLRALAWLGGLLGIAVTVRLGRDLHSPLVGWSAGAVMGASGLFGLYLHEVRPYSWLPLVTALCLWGYWGMQQNRARRTPYGAILFVGVVGCLYLHYFAIVIPFGVGVYHLLFAPKTRRWWLPVGVMFAAALTFIPWLGVLLRATSITQNDSGLSVYALTSLQAVSHTAQRLSNQNAALLAALLGIGLFSRPASARDGRRFILTVSVAAFAAMLTINALTRSLTQDRYLLVLWAVLALWSGFGLAGMARYGRPLPIAVILGVIGLWGVGYYTNDDFRENIAGPGWFLAWDQFAATVQPDARPTDLMALHLPDRQEGWTHEIVQRWYMQPIAGDDALVLYTRTMDDNAYAEQARGLDAARVWYAYDPSWLPERGWIYENALKERYVECSEPLNNADLRVRLYYRFPTAVPPIVFDAPTAPIGLHPLEVRAHNGTLEAVLAWDVPAEVPAYTYSVAIHGLDDSGALTAQADVALPMSGGRGCTTAHLPSAGVAALWVRVYAWETGQRLPLNGADGFQIFP